MAEFGYKPGGDFGQGYLAGVVVAQPNVARGKRLFADEVFVRQFHDVMLASEPRGIKARLGHSSKTESVGTALGHWRNPRIGADGKLRADLHLAGYAARSPKGDLLAYAVATAIENPEALGASAMLTRDGAAEEAFMASHMLNGRFRSPNAANPANHPHMRVLGMSSIDLVDYAALNVAGLFEDEIDPVRERLCADIRELSKSMPLSEAIVAVQQGRTKLERGNAVRPLIRIR